MARQSRQQGMERGTTLPVERREEFALDALDDRAESGQLALPLRGEADDMPAPIVWIAAPLDQPVLLEGVE